MNDVQKTEQRAWKLEKDMEQVKEELTSARMALQHADFIMDDDRPKTGAAAVHQSFVPREESLHSAQEIKEERRQHVGDIMLNQGRSEDSWA